MKKDNVFIILLLAGVLAIGTLVIFYLSTSIQPSKSILETK